jgi:hypothetical protein
MKQLILIKPCREIQAAHLYEHLMWDAIFRMFRERDLFAHLDWSCER